MTPGSKPNALVVVVVARAPQLEQVVDPVAGVGLGVGAVELDVAEGALGHGVAVLDPGGQLRLPAPDRQGSDQPFRERHGRVGPLELALHPPAPGEGPLGHVDGLAPVVVERVAAEEVLRRARPGARSAGGSARPRRRGTRVGRPGLGPVRGHGEDGGHHQVHRDHVDDALGHAGELAQQAAGVRDDDRLGHAEAADPPGPRLGQRRLDDGRPHEGDRDACPRHCSTSARSPRALVKG